MATVSKKLASLVHDATESVHNLEGFFANKSLTASELYQAELDKLRSCHNQIASILASVGDDDRVKASLGAELVLPFDRMRSIIADAQEIAVHRDKIDDDQKHATLVAILRALRIHVDAFQQRAVEQVNFLSVVLSSLPCLISYMDTDLNYLYVNEAYERWFGLSKERCLKSNMRDIVGEIGMTALQPRIDAVLRGEMQDFEIELPYRLGKARAVHAKYLPDFDAKERVKGIVVMVDDVTERVESEKRFKEIYENSPLGIIRIDEKFNYLAVNKAYEQIFGYSEEELKQKTMLEITHPDDVAATREKARLMSEEGINLRRFEKRYIHKSGRVVWGLVTSRGYDDGHGNRGYLSIIEDITDIKQSKIEADTIFETMSEGLIIQNSQGGIERYNPEALRILEIDRADVAKLEERWWSIKPEGIGRTRDEHPAMVALAKNKPTRNVLMSFTLLSGEERWININAMPFEGKGERKVAITFDDLTDLVRANADVNYIFKHSLDLMCIATMDAKFSRVSPSFSKILGYSEEELVEATFFQFIHPDDVAATREAVWSLTNGVPLIDFENRYRSKSGDYRLISWVCEPDLGAGVIYATGRDVTVQRLQEQRNKQIFAAIDQAAIVAYTDPRGTITSVNDNFCRISGFTSDELIGKDHRIINSGRHPQSFFEDMWRTITSGKVWTGDIENRAKDGRSYYVRTVISPIRRLDNTIESYIAIRFDITGQKLAEQRAEAERLKAIQSAKLASLGEMAAGVAHEINNPLAIIAGTVRVIPKFLADPDSLQRRIDTIEKSTERIAKIVRSLKKFSRSSEKNEYKEKKLSELVSEALTLTETKSKRFSTPVCFTLKQDVTILCDEIEIEQVLVNLIHNGIDAVQNLDERWVHLEVLDQGKYAVIRVTDSGKGIAEEIRDKLFQPFFTTKVAGEGTGLGLSIVKGILDDHNASIDILTTEANTCFEIRFQKVQNQV